MHQIWTALQHDGPNHLGLWLIRSFYITNLFVGVLVSYFGQSSGSGILTDEQVRAHNNITILQH